MWNFNFRLGPCIKALWYFVHMHLSDRYILVFFYLQNNSIQKCTANIHSLIKNYSHINITSLFFFFLLTIKSDVVLDLLENVKFGLDTDHFFLCMHVCLWNFLKIDILVATWFISVSNGESILNAYFLLPSRGYQV